MTDTVLQGKRWALAKEKREIHPAEWGGEDLTPELDSKARMPLSRQRGNARWEVQEDL